MALVVAANIVTPSAGADFSPKPARTWATNGRVNAILPLGDRIFVAGSFSAVVDTSGVSYPARNLAVFSATTGRADLSFGVGTNNTVYALATDGASTLFLGGSFGTVTSGATEPRPGLAAVNVTTGALSPWAPAVTGGQVDNMAFRAATGTVYAVGNFTSVTSSGGGSSSARPFVAKVDAATGEVDTAFAASPDARVRAVAVVEADGRLFLGGDFLSVSGANKTRAVAAVDLASGAISPGFAAASTNKNNLAPVFDLVADATRLYVAAGGAGGACTALNLTTGALAWTNHANGNMQTVRLIGTTLYCGGHFGGSNGFAGAKRQKLAAVTAATGDLLAFTPKINTPLGTWALGTQPGNPNLYLGGDFTRVSGVSQRHFAMFLANPGPPGAPGDLLAQPADGRVLLSWPLPSSDGGSPITSFSVYRGTTPGGENLTQRLVKLSKTATSYTDFAVVNGTTYYYVVAATNSLGEGALSNEGSATPGGTTTAPPGPPLAAAATNPPGTVELTWNPPASDGGAAVTSYSLYRGLSPGGEDPTPYATGITAPSFSDPSDGDAGTTYYYTVTATNSAGEGPPSAEVSATQQAGVPGTPDLTGSWSAGVAELSWTEPPDGGSPITKYVLLRDSVKIAANLPPSQTSYADSFPAGETHVYQVKAVSAQGAGKNSPKLTIAS